MVTETLNQNRVFYFVRKNGNFGKCPARWQLSPYRILKKRYFFEIQATKKPSKRWVKIK